MRPRDDPLPSWRDTAPRQAIAAFVEKVTKEDSPDFVAPAERIAVFDNDGTLWAEQPLYFQLKYEVRDGRPVLVKLPQIQFVDDKEGKPAAIQTFIGRRPIAAFGNSDGDLQMLEWTTAGAGARLCVIVRHTDAEREWAYDRESQIGKLDKALDAAPAHGWVVVSIKDDWTAVFPE